jgi:alginate O-acetyltransferase complex protein AlgI
LVFSSVTFLFYFLPIVLLLYYLFPKRNTILLVSSIFFYAWGEVYFVFILILSIFINYIFGLLIDRELVRARRQFLLAVAVAINLSLIGCFKYLNFIIENMNSFFGGTGFPMLNIGKIHLPLGISFFTFQAISYLVDVYRKTSKAEHNPMTLGLYISMFPQLVAGPIVRFNQIVDQLHFRVVSSEKFAYGVRRFIVGLGQKVLVANALAVPADAIFKIAARDLNAGLAWLGTFSYTFQIYYDFAGYSNMAIGLGLMFGFKIPENFKYPYVSRSIREFWRRWHMTLSEWFRDYLYIPMGGNRRGPFWTYFNLFVVFFLCGLWHGANWTFVVWGLFHGLFLVLERIGLQKIIDPLWRPLQHVYALCVVCVGWVFFRSDTIAYAVDFLKAMTGLYEGNQSLYSVHAYLTKDVMIAFTIGIIGSGPIVPMLGRLWQTNKFIPYKMGSSYNEAAIRIFETIALTSILALVAMNLAAQTHNPFIYFRF